MDKNSNPTRIRKAEAVDDFRRIFDLAAVSVQKTKESGFGKITLTLNVRHGSICEAVIEENNTTTVKL